MFRSFTLVTLLFISLAARAQSPRSYSSSEILLQMKKLANEGGGLATYISQNVKDAYESYED